MKTLTGKVVSSTPISVSKAAKIIANFAATDNGASQAISAYLRRASASFNELKQFHRELRKGSKSDRKHKRSKSEVTVEGAGESSFEPSVFNLTRGAVELSQEASHGDGDSERNKHKNKKKEKDKEKGEMGNFGDGGGKIIIEDGESKRNRKEEKKNEGNFGEDEGNMVIDQSEGKKHKKKDKSGKKIETLQENGVSIEKGEMGNEEKREGEEKKKKKKRKSGDIEGTENNSSSAPRKKKKKIKTEVDN
ncbi:hypothetical protein PTKIN_Ptkin11bG0018200 [Pterospermum kingtungense]